MATTVIECDDMLVALRSEIMNTSTTSTTEVREAATRRVASLERQLQQTLAQVENERAEVKKLDDKIVALEQHLSGPIAIRVDGLEADEARDRQRDAQNRRAYFVGIPNAAKEYDKLGSLGRLMQRAKDEAARIIPQLRWARLSADTGLSTENIREIVALVAAEKARHVTEDAKPSVPEIVTFAATKNEEHVNDQ